MIGSDTCQLIAEAGVNHNGDPGLDQGEGQPAEDVEVEVVHLDGDLPGAIGGNSRRLHIALPQVVAGLQHRQETEGAARTRVLEQVQAPGEPAVAARPFASIEQVEHEPEDATRGPVGVFVLQALVMRTDPEGVGIVVRSGQAGRCRLPLEFVHPRIRPAVARRISHHSTR